MDSEKWGIIDDCSYWLNPDNPDAGRGELSHNTAEFERKCSDLLALWIRSKYWTGLIAVFTLGLSTARVFTTWQQRTSGVGLGEILIGITFLAFIIMALVWRAPAIAQMLSIDWANKGPFDDPCLARPKAYLAAQANLTDDLFTHDGKFASRDILHNVWALLYLTTNNDLYALPISAGSKSLTGK